MVQLTEFPCDTLNNAEAGSVYATNSFNRYFLPLTNEINPYYW
jgi:hypothetical protein